MKPRSRTFALARARAARFLKEVPHWAWLIVFAVLAALIVVSHRPDAILNAQFWAEDGRVWYAQAYEMGPFAALVTPEAGYFQTVSRIVAAISLLFPFKWAPLVLNIFAIGLQAFNAAFIVSDRMSQAMPSRSFRLAAAFIYLAYPNSYETTANLTNSQWHLGFTVFLIVMAKPAEHFFVKVFDRAVVGLSALTGPFCIFLVPIAAIKYFYRRERRLLVFGIILLAGAAIQIISLTTHARPYDEALGASFSGAVRILSGQCFITPLVGTNNYGLLFESVWWTTPFAAAVAAAGLFVFVLAFVWGKQELRLLIIFAFLVVLSAFLNPAVTDLGPQWAAMETPLAASRYWMFPSIAFLVSLLFLATNQRSGRLRYLFVLPAALMVWGFTADWKHPKLRDLDFPAHAAEFEAARPGDLVTIPINPNWEMRLKKR